MIIAEIGNNHLGSENIAREMVDALITTNIDGITFQIREDGYYDGTKSYRTCLRDEFFKEMIKIIKESGKKVGFAIGDPARIDFFNENGVDFWKSLSWDILNDALQKKLASTEKPVFISTGVSDMDDIKEASERYSSAHFIHTQLTYGADEANLKAIQTMREITGKNVAFGSHCEEKNVLYVSLGFEPSDIFFYVRKSDEETYPDHKHAIVLEEVDEITKNLKHVQKAVGDGRKVKKENELKSDKGTQ